MSKSYKWGAAFLVGLLVSGCAADYGPVADGPVAYLDGALSDRAVPNGVAPVLQSGDKIKVTVYGEDNLNGIYDIDPSGSVNVPLAGTIRAAGRTKGELQRDIAR